MQRPLLLKQGKDFITRIDRKRIRQFLNDKFNMTDDILMDWIYKFFNSGGSDEIDGEEWNLGFNTFLKGECFKPSSRDVTNCFQGLNQSKQDIVSTLTT